MTHAEAEAQRVLAEARAEFEAMDELWQGYLIDVELLAGLQFSLGVQKVPDLKVGDRQYAAFLEASRGLIVVEANHHEHRRRFSVAHEIGHFVLHYRPQVGGDTYHCTEADMEQGTRPLRQEPDNAPLLEVTRYEHLRREWEANRFAAALLMPEQPLLAMYRVVGGSLSRLAKQFRVSPQALEIRLKELPLPYRPKR